VQEVADRTGKELTSADIWTLFEKTYLGRDGIALADYSLLPEPRAPERRRIVATVRVDGTERTIEGVGNGPIDAFVDALKGECGIAMTVGDYREHALGGGADAQATAYVEIRDANGATLWGVGIDANIVTASLKALASAATRAR
jgi:2-isopropylmalate synthase